MTGDLTDSQLRWLRIRSHLTSNRHPLAVQAFDDFDLEPTGA